MTAYAGPFTRPGMSSEQINAVERSVVTTSDLDGKDLACAICLADFELGEESRRLQCRHLFHRECLDEWLRNCSTCPLCNDDVMSPRSALTLPQLSPFAYDREHQD